MHTPGPSPETAVLLVLLGPCWSDLRCTKRAHVCTVLGLVGGCRGERTAAHPFPSMPTLAYP